MAGHDIVADKIRDYYLKHKVKHRREVLAKCGKKAFLDPEDLAYPVANPWTCETDCGLVKAANIRAHQFHNTKMIDKVKSLLQKCEK